MRRRIEFEGEGEREAKLYHSPLLGCWFVAWKGRIIGRVMWLRRQPPEWGYERAGAYKQRHNYRCVGDTWTRAQAVKELIQDTERMP